MASSPSQATYVHRGYWDNNSRKHPGTKWMEKYNVAYDTCDKNFSPDWYSEDLSMTKSDGQVVNGRDAVIKSLQELYGPMTAFSHEPFFVMMVETENEGWEMLAQANVFANLPGKPAAGEKKVKDLQGREWDMSVPGAFRFEGVKAPDAANGHGFLLKKAYLMSDSGVPMAMMMKRGLISAKDLGL